MPGYLSSLTGVGKAVLNSPGAHTLAAGLGVVHGAVDMAIGGKEIYKGIKYKDKGKILSGAFDTAIGASIVAISVGGGIPAAIALGTVFLAKVGYRRRKGIKQAAGKAGKTARWTGNKTLSAASTMKNAAVNTGQKIKSGAGWLKNKIARRKDSDTPKEPVAENKGISVEMASGVIGTQAQSKSSPTGGTDHQVPYYIAE